MRSKRFPNSEGVTKFGGSDLPWEKTTKGSFASVYSDCDSASANGHYLSEGVVPPSSGQARVNILGVGVSAVNMDTALRQTELLLDRGEQGYVCVTGVHGIMEAQSDDAFREILNHSFLTTPDGMPTVWLGRVHGFKDMNRVYGPDYMLGLCQRSVTRGYRHFLYGGKPGVAEELRADLTRRFPGLQIVGTYTPPFRPLNPGEEEDLRSQLEASQADVLWCGLSTPKQERFISTYYHQMPVKLMVGVGAAFDLLSGNLSEAPDWMKRAGLQWLYRLIREPKRLWRRYLLNNPKFAWLTFLQLTGLRGFQLS
jgi:N-acetylglucosaminyldiphosphoundecaprenol N-acetyl-beta-D-mannosaminyltransferase